MDSTKAGFSGQNRRQFHVRWSKLAELWKWNFHIRIIASKTFRKYCACNQSVCDSAPSWWHPSCQAYIGLRRLFRGKKELSSERPVILRARRRRTLDKVDRLIPVFFVEHSDASVLFDYLPRYRIQQNPSLFLFCGVLSFNSNLIRQDIGKQQLLAHCSYQFLHPVLSS